MKSSVMWRRAAVLFLLIFAVSLTAYAERQYWPTPNRDFYVYDQAGLLSPSDAAAMLAAGESLAVRDGTQVVVVTVRSLSGHAIETYATTLFRDWGIGHREKNNGVLLLIAQEERQSRIEVGYGLEAVLTDGWCGTVLDRMGRRFQAGDFSTAIREAYAALAVRAGGGLEEVPDAVRALAAGAEVSPIAAGSPVAEVPTASGDASPSASSDPLPDGSAAQRSSDPASDIALPAALFGGMPSFFGQVVDFLGLRGGGYVAMYLYFEALWLALRLFLELLLRLFGYRPRLYRLRFLLICLVWEYGHIARTFGGGGGFGGRGNFGGGGRSGGGGASGGW
ncbi:MAG: TPM domain-containing protein [Schwartzia sp. (in: firmicutes)]